MDMTRRAVALGPLLACQARAEQPQQGRAIYSESVMLSGADAAGRHFAAVRACTYPDAHVAWLWCMLLTPDGFWQFASNDIAWGGRAVAPEPEALYSVDSGSSARNRTLAIFAREGPHARPARATLAANFRSDPRLGERHAPVAAGDAYVEAVFEPAAGFGGLLPGRSESFGHARFKCRVRGREIVFEGPAQFHEQPQTEPRFTSPFIFSSLWSADVFATALKTPQGGGGYLIDRGAPQQMKDLRASIAPGALGLDADARHVALESARDYRVPIYGRDWRGRFVRGRYGARPVVGFLNSWMM